jgi:E3 ubiquitin-protein ligase UBR3
MTPYALLFNINPEVILLPLSRLEQGLESDLFLLQCCAALSSPEFFVRTIQERFGLSNYTSLELGEQNE